MCSLNVIQVCAHPIERVQAFVKDKLFISRFVIFTAANIEYDLCKAILLMGNFTRLLQYLYAHVCDDTLQLDLRRDWVRHSRARLGMEKTPLRILLRNRGNAIRGYSSCMA
jgi:hypothetical protein